MQAWTVGVIVAKRVMFTHDWDHAWVEEPRSDGIKSINYSSSVGVRSSSEQQRLLSAAILGPAEGPRE